MRACYASAMAASPAPGSVVLDLVDQAATEALGAWLARLARPGDAILLAGPIGAGKSTLARALLREAAGDAALDVPSPSFTLLQTYDLPRGRVHHFDLWRLGDAADVRELGWEEARRDIVLVEWPERLGDLAPDDALRVVLTPVSDDARRAELQGWAARLATTTLPCPTSM